MSGSRAIGRDVQFYLFSEPDKPLGGMRLHPSVTEKVFLSMLGTLIVASGGYRVTLRSTGVDLTPTDESLKPGNYDIRPCSCRVKIALNDEPCITRILSRTITGRDDLFRARVRERDGKCVITGVDILPLSSEGYWIQKGYTKWITNRVGERDTGINSSQNGLLMLSNIHQKFDSFSFSINPDDGYKITCFDDDPFRIDGRVLESTCQESIGLEGVRDELLRWHFRQAVLANMRGAGEPLFEMDFPPGTDMMGEILSGPEPGKRMEAELFSRFSSVHVE
ncbi:hypothetical protein V1525DRAFT_349180 [Lipomyces kononenkoae]|uniref:Uncharacterized protein n=1 Tax=Lipomyces kononenkoae TaxID=34357 RepID=A0ACC3SW32_LIPKO